MPGSINRYGLKFIEWCIIDQATQQPVDCFILPYTMDDELAYTSLKSILKVIDYHKSKGKKTISKSIPFEISPAASPGQTLTVKALKPPPERDASYMELMEIAAKALASTTIKGVKEVDLDKLVDRFNFMGIKRSERKSGLLISMNVMRTEMPDILCLDIESIHSHFKRKFKRIGTFKDKELRDIYTCSDEYYAIHYLKFIEINRQIDDENYIKKKTN